MKENKKIGVTAKKNENFSEWFTQVTGPEGAELADVRYGVQGFIVHMPWAMKILNKIYSYLEEGVEKDGHEQVLFPTVIKKESLEREAKHAGFSPNVFWVTKAGDKKMEEPVALRPTGETQIYPMYSLWIRSHSQLPLKMYQSRITTFRNEMTTRPFLRGREFMFFETHDVFTNHDNAMAQIESDKNIMEEVIGEKLKIPHIFFKRPSWDKFLGADDTYVADTLMPDGKRNQLSSTHDLGINFAKAYNIKFSDNDEKKKFAFQTCFGPGIWRIMAALIGIHGDDNGLILPFDVAPYQIVLVPVLFSDKKKNDVVLKKCLDVRKKLGKYRVFLDDSDNTSGWKYNHWEMKGVPLRIEIGPRDVEKNEVVVVDRFGEKLSVKDTDLLKVIEKTAKKLDDKIEVKANEYFSENTKNADDLREVKKIMASFRGFVKAPWCSLDKDGESCAETLKEETSGGNVCGVPWGNKTKESGSGKKCIICGKPAKYVVYLAKSW